MIAPPMTAPRAAATTITPAAAETARHRTRYGRPSPYTTAKAPSVAVAAARSWPSAIPARAGRATATAARIVPGQCRPTRGTRTSAGHARAGVGIGEGLRSTRLLTLRKRSGQ